jgi:hypothetical protein
MRADPYCITRLSQDHITGTVGSYLLTRVMYEIKIVRTHSEHSKQSFKVFLSRSWLIESLRQTVKKSFYS